MNSILFWIIPPVVGAVIGYVTNLVAIKMLFRPLNEVRLLNHRLPFTPGILPRERAKLAESIGGMVERELLTPGVLRERLGRTEVRENIGQALSGYSGQLLDRPLSYWLENRDEDFPLKEILRDFFNSDVFDSFLEEIIKNWFNRKIETDEEEDGFGSWIKSRLRDFNSIFIPPARRMLKNSFVREIKKEETSIYVRALESIIAKYPGITLKEFLAMGDSKKKKVDSFLAGKTTDALDENIEGALSSVNVKVLVSDRINSLEMIRVEKIILDVMAGQLKWINVFGGLLGALIGFVQVILSVIMNRISF